jgi:hypothetical protein
VAAILQNILQLISLLPKQSFKMSRIRAGAFAVKQRFDKNLKTKSLNWRVKAFCF